MGLQAPGICMMRTNNLMAPSSWRAWDGQAYSVSFADPYTTHDDPSKHICVVTNLPAGGTGQKPEPNPRGCAPAGLVWSAYLEKFVVTLGCGATFKLATSDDLIIWSEPQELDVKHLMPANTSVMVRVRARTCWCW